MHFCIDLACSFEYKTDVIGMDTQLSSGGQENAVTWALSILNAAPTNSSKTNWLQCHLSSESLVFESFH